MEERVINIKLPRGWDELSEKRLWSIFELLASGMAMGEVRSLCFLSWSGMQVLGHSPKGHFIKLGKDKLLISTEKLAAAMEELSWMDEMPARPFALPPVGRLKPLDVSFHEVPFGNFLACDNYYQGYLQTQREELLDNMAEVIYGRRINLKGAARLMLCYYFSVLKSYFARQWPHFLRDASGAERGNMLAAAPTQAAVRETMNSQLRALTKGDVTKESEVLALDTWRAMTELDALAKDFEEFNSKYGKNGS